MATQMQERAAGSQGIAVSSVSGRRSTTPRKPVSHSGYRWPFFVALFISIISTVGFFGIILTLLISG